MTRRSVLGVGLAGAAALAVGAPGAVAAGVALSPADEDLLVHIAGTIAVLPVPFPAFGEQGAASTRATRERLHPVLDRLHATGRSEVADGLAMIRPVVSVTDDHETVVRGFGELVAENGAVDGLAAVVAVGVSMLASRFDPASRSGAALWLDYAARFADRMSTAAKGVAE